MRKFFWIPVLSAGVVAAAMAAEVQRTAKVEDKVPRIPLPVQNEVYPEDAKRVVHKDPAPRIVPTAAEKEAGMVIFSRPLTEPVWAENSPLPHERIINLSGWGAKKQFVTLNFAVYPLKNLKDLKVRFEGKAKPELRIVRYWDIVYPNYNSFRTEPKNKRFQRMPEFLAPFTSGDFPAREPQRFCLTFQLPADGTTEIQGDVIVSHSDFKQALKLPLSIKVLPFELKQDPNKHYSAYYYSARRSPFARAHKNEPELLHKIQLDEFRKMREYGFTRPPVMNISYGTLPDGTKDAFYIPDMKEVMAELKEAGFPVSAAIPVCGCANYRFYKKYTGKSFGSFHMEKIDCSIIPDKLYADMGKALDRFLAYAKKNNYPAMIFNPIDEPSTNSMPHVIKVTKLFKDRGLVTFQTSPPENFRKKADKLFDIYNFGAFHASYEEATSGKKKEYWCYPNDNTYQIKDPDVMCHGGRMTYGLGYWRSGFHCIIPWIWGNNNPRRVCNSGGVLRVADGSILIPIYWECFRLGVDDERYIYTLQDAIVKRENSWNPFTRHAVSQAKEVLQKTWNATCPQAAYLRDNLLHHAELDARRAEIAAMICKLAKYPECNQKAASSVIIDPKGKYVPEKPFENGDKISMEFDKWRPIARELTMTPIPNGKLVQVKIDHKMEGENYGGKSFYPIGWPRIRADFGGKTGVDFTKFTHLEFDLTVTSDRDIQSDYHWPLSFTARSRNGESCEFRFITTLEPKVKHKIRIPIAKFRPISRAGLKQLCLMQLVVSESNYPHGTNLTLKFENIRAVGFARPAITEIAAPNLLALPASGFSCFFTVTGAPENQPINAKAELLDAKGNVIESGEFPVVDGKAFCGFSGAKLKPGLYTVRGTLSGDKNFVEKQFRVINGPSNL